MSGHVGCLTPQEEQALKQIPDLTLDGRVSAGLWPVDDKKLNFGERYLYILKEKVADVHKLQYDDYYYLRWLRARDFDVGGAEAMIRKNLIFRKKMEADTILDDYQPHELIDKFYPRGYLGPDKEGCPVRFLPFKNLDLRGFIYSVKKSDVLKFLTYLFEQDIKEMEEMSQKTGKVVEKHSYIVDIEGYTFRQATNRESLNLLNDILKLYEANYPERLKTTYFINVPAYFNIILNLSKPFLSENTLKKFRIFGKDFTKALLNDMDADILPQSLGGNRTDPDGNPMCYSIITYGSKIDPEHYVLKSSVRSLEEHAGVSSLKVNRQSYCMVDIAVAENRSRIEWEFETPTKDIAVGLYFRRSEEQYEEILPPERVSCHLVPESGTYMCETPGTYALKFDNTFSWVSSKRVFYQIKVKTPSELTEENAYF